MTTRPAPAPLPPSAASDAPFPALGPADEWEGGSVGDAHARRGFALPEWLSLGALWVGTLHILLDFGVGLFPLQGTVSLPVGLALVLNAAIPVWFAVSLGTAAWGSHRTGARGGALASLALLGAGWTLLTNGYPIVYCPPACAPGWPLSDIAHVGSIALGLAAPAAALWSLARRRPRVAWPLPAGALALVVANIVALANAVPSGAA